jgi:hypothetical protein
MFVVRIEMASGRSKGRGFTLRSRMDVKCVLAGRKVFEIEVDFDGLSTARVGQLRCPDILSIRVFQGYGDRWVRGQEGRTEKEHRSRGKHFFVQFEPP